MGTITYMNFDEHTHTAFGWIGNMELLCAKGGEQRETQANELLFMIFFFEPQRYKTKRKCLERMLSLF